MKATMKTTAARLVVLWGLGTGALVWWLWLNEQIGDDEWGSMVPGAAAGAGIVVVVMRILSR